MQEKLKAIRTELKEMGFSSRQVSVKVQHGGYDSAIHIRLKSEEAMIQQSVIEERLGKYENYSRDEMTQEILQGGNTFISVGVDYELTDKLVEKYNKEMSVVMEEAKKEIDSVRSFKGNAFVCRSNGLFYFVNAGCDMAFGESCFKNMLVQNMR